jgi:hypothetical protein
MPARTDAVNDSAAAASCPGKSIDPHVVDGMQALQTGFKLARASQLTMLRLRLALHGSNPHTAMQALDILLDIDAEMEGISARLISNPGHPFDNAALSGFIQFQKTAIAAEKHALTGGDRRGRARSVSIPAACGPADNIDLSAQPSFFSDDEVEESQPANGQRWATGFALAIIFMSIGLGLIAYLWPAISVALKSF